MNFDLFKLILVRSSEYSTRSIYNVPFFNARHNFPKNYFLVSAIIQWNNLDLNIRNSSSLNIFRNGILKFIRPSASSAFLTVSLFITRLRLVLSHLRECKFKYSFQDLLNPTSNCELDIESPFCYLLHYSTHTLLSTLKNIDNNFLGLTKPIFTTIPLFGSNSFDTSTYTNTLNATMNLVYLLKDLTKRFFNEFTDSCRNEVHNKKLNKSVSI